MRRARYVPAALVATALGLAALVSPWWLLSIPFILIGTLFTAPNLNLIDGSLSFLSMIGGFILLAFQGAAGLAVLTGVAASFLGSALEMFLTAKPVGE